MWYLGIYRKTKEKIQLSLKSDFTCTLHEDQRTLTIISRPLLLRMRNTPDKFVEKINTHVLRSITFFMR